MQYATDHTGAGSLSALMDFDHVIRVHSDGTVTEPGTHAPDLYQWEEADGTWSESLDGGSDWTLLTGYSGQYGYSGPMMHASEQIAGGIATHILSTPGEYVALCPSCKSQDGSTVEPDSWAIAFRPLS